MSEETCTRPYGVGELKVLVAQRIAGTATAVVAAAVVRETGIDPETAAGIAETASREHAGQEITVPTALSVLDRAVQLAQRQL